MKICLSCRQAWPDSSAYCGTCQRSFDGRRCPHGHLSPTRAQCCLQCGNSDLSESTQSANTGTFTRILAWVIFIVLLKLTRAQVIPLAGQILSFGDWLAGFVFGARISELFAKVIQAFFPLAILTLVICALSPRARKALPTGMRYLFKAIRALLKGSWIALRLAFSLSRRLVQGDEHNDQQTPRRSRS